MKSTSSMRDKATVVISMIMTYLMADWASAFCQTLKSLPSASFTLEAVAFSPDGNWLAVGGNSFHIELWDVNTGQKIKDFKMPSEGGRLETVSVIAFSSTGKYMASATGVMGNTKGKALPTFFKGGMGQDIYLWETATGMLVKKLAGNETVVTSLCFNSDETYLASGTINEIKIFELPSGKKTEIKFKGHFNHPFGFNKDGQLIVVHYPYMETMRQYPAVSVAGITSSLLEHYEYAPNSFTVKTWSLATGKESDVSVTFGDRWELIVKLYDLIGINIKAIPAQSEVISVEHAPHINSLFVLKQGNQIEIWDETTGNKSASLQRSNDIQQMAVAPSGQYLATVGNSNIVSLWNLALISEVGRSEEGHTDSAEKSISKQAADSKPIAVAYELFTPLIRTFTVGGTNTIKCIAYSPDGKMLASGGWKNTIKLWGVQSGYELKTLTWRTNYVVNVTSVAFSPNGKFLASGSEEDGNSIKLWDLQTGWELKTLTKHDDVSCVTFSPDGRKLAVASWRGCPWCDDFITLWEVKSGDVQKILAKHSGNTLFFSPDGRTLASGADLIGTIKLWDVQSGRELQALTGHSGDVLSVAFSPDGKILASGGKDTSVILWDALSGRELKTLRGHSLDVNSVAFSPDGRSLASASDDKTVRLWDVMSGQELQVLQGYSDEVLSIAFSPDGRTLASGSNDETIKTWDVSLLDSELARLYWPIGVEKDSSLEAIAALFKPKDEFETTVEYQARLANANAQKRKIEDKHVLKFTELKNGFFRRKELETQEKIRASRTEVTLSIERIGEYNANDETFPITIEGMTKDIRIPRAEARSFKEKWQSVIAKGVKQLNKHLVRYEYVDLIIIHPETGNRFPFVEP